MKNKKKYKVLYRNHIIFKILNFSLVNIVPGNFSVGGIHLLKVDMIKVYEMKNDNMYTILIKDSLKLESGKFRKEMNNNTELCSKLKPILFFSHRIPIYSI